MSEFKDMYLTVTADNESVTIYPKTCQLKNALCNENLQHEESSATLTLNYDRDTFRLLALSDELDAVLYDGNGSPIFTGVINDLLSWEDLGNPYPVDTINVTVLDYTGRLEQKTSVEIGYINEPLENIVQRICGDCSVSFAPAETGISVPAFILDQGASYKTSLDNLLFQYGFTYYFDAAGILHIWDFKEIPAASETLDDSEIFMRPKITRLSKKYRKITVKYNSLTEKTDELVYFAGSGYTSENTAAPAIVQKNVYYPFESDPNVESDSGKVQQSFESGFAESYKKYNGETAYRRSSTAQLVYTENCHVVEDWENGNIIIDRTDFGYRQAAVRLLNKGDEDAKVYSISIRANAWYRGAEHSVSAGNGTNEYVCESEFIFDSESATALVNSLTSYFYGVKYKLEVKTDHCIPIGTFKNIDTGLSGFHTLAIAVGSTFDAELDLYTTTFISLDEPLLKPLTRESKIYTTLKGEKGDKGEPGPQGEPGKKGADGTAGGTLTVYAEQTSMTFRIDSLGGVEGTELYIPIHAGINEEEVSFKIECPADTSGVSVAEYQTENSHGIKISTTKNSRISGGCFTVIVFSDNEESFQFSHALVFSYSVSNESVYRGAKSEITDFLNPNYEGRLVFGDWFTWTGGNSTGTYGGVKVTFKTGKVYKWDGDIWVEDNDQSHLMTALSDILTVTKENLEANNSRMIALLDRLTGNEAYLEKLGSDKLCALLAANEMLAKTLVANETFTGELSAEKTFTDSLVANSVFAEALATNRAFLNQLVSTKTFTQVLETSGEAYFGESKRYTDSATEGIGKSVEEYAAAASTSASNAASSATSASTSATNAGKSATAAATSESNASKSATSASTSATNASKSESNAKSSADTAASKATAASTSASNAATSATSASTSATSAATSESNASKSASSASTSASNAATSATAAANSAIAAANSAASAKTTADNIEKNYVKKTDAMAAYETVYFRTNNGSLAVPSKPTSSTAIQTTDVADKWTTASTNKTYTFTYVCYRYKAKATDTSYTYTNISCEAAALIKNGKIIANLLDVDTLFSNEIILKPNGNQLNKYGDANSFRSEQYSYTPHSPIGTSIIGDIRGFRLATLKVNSAFLGMFVCTFMRGDEIAANTVRAGGINIEDQATDSYGTYDKSVTSFSPAGGFATAERTSAIATPVKVFAVERKTEQIGSTSHDSMHLLSPKDFIFTNKDSSLPGIFLKFLSGSSTKYEQQGIVEHSFGTSFGYIKWANGLLIQWGIELVNKNTRYNDITYNAYSLPPIVLLSATRSATRWESAGFVGAINITKNGFRASYGEYEEATNIEKYTWLAIGVSA